MPMPFPLRSTLLAAAALALAACSAPQGPRSARAPDAGVAGAGGTAGAPSTPGPTSRRGGYYMDDGPGDTPPPDLAAIADAVPRYEPLLPRTARPYSVFGRQYTPMAQLAPYRERGAASWYGRRYHGQPTSSGERYDMYAMTAAHPTLPIPSYARVTHLGSGRSVVVRINDRGPFLQNRIIDLSYTAAAKLGYVEAGSAEVEVELFTNFDQPLLAGAAAANTAGANAAVAGGAPVRSAAAAGRASSNAPTAIPVVYNPGGSAASAAATSKVASSAGATANGDAARTAVLLAANGQAVPSSDAVQGAGGASSAPSKGPGASAAAAAPAAAEAPVRLTVETIYAPGEPPRSEARSEPERYDPGVAPAGAAAGVGSPAPSAPAAPSAMPSTAAPAAAMPSSATAPVKAAPAAVAPAAAPATAPRIGDAAGAVRPSAASAAAARGYWLQLGAFATLENAQIAREQFARRLDWLQTGFDVRQDGALFKVQAGPWTSRDQAQSAAGRIRAATELQPFMATR
ncbi:MAG: septal ring lytic transglycosylase RlpA family protein [Burkholderiales bacterium]|nr:septal ring lytic transglycosylase RlpA family protein [Burkholderiales bacterium]